MSVVVDEHGRQVQIAAAFSWEEERRFLAALGVTKAQPTAAELVAAAEAQRLELEETRQRVRTLEAQDRWFESKESELQALRRELELERARQQARREDDEEEAKMTAAFFPWTASDR